jgi:hypothetical protein
MLLADYHEAYEKFDEASNVILDRIRTRKLPPPAEILTEESARDRMVVARSLLWATWRETS